MNTEYKRLGLNVSLDYAKYKSIKPEGEYVDFLLSYDAKGAGEGDDSWFSKLFSGVDLSTLPYPIREEAVKSAGVAPLGGELGFDISLKVNALKLQLTKAFEERIDRENKDVSLADAKKAALYESIRSISLPSRLT